jgi:acetyl-CoA synthetase
MLRSQPNKTAIIFEADDGKVKTISYYQELYERVCQFSNGLKTLNLRYWR